MHTRKNLQTYNFTNYATLTSTAAGAVCPAPANNPHVTFRGLPSTSIGTARKKKYTASTQAHIRVEFADAIHLSQRSHYSSPFGAILYGLACFFAAGPLCARFSGTLALCIVPAQTWLLRARHLRGLRHPCPRWEIPHNR